MMMFSWSSSSRLLAVVVLLCGLVLVVSANGDAPKQPKHDVTVCATKPGDKVLSLLQVSDDGHYLGKASLDVIYPPDGETEANVINCIMIKDLKPDVGATATITNGTIGSTKVSIHLESSFTKGLSFSIKIMGQKA